MFGLECERDLEFFCKIATRGVIPLSEISPREMESMYYWMDVGNMCLKKKMGSTKSLEDDDSLLTLTSQGKEHYRLLEEFMGFLTSYTD